jgi:hypothetical protein
MKGPGLADLIDLEVQLRADAALAPEELHARDGAIGQRIDAASLDDREAALRWLEEIRIPNGPGALAEQRRNQASALLVVLGFGLGALSVGTWLATGTREPVNVVYFWPAFVGSQIALAIGFWVAIAPPKVFERVPLLGALHALLRSLAVALPRGVARLLRRLAPSTGERWADTLGELRRLDWLYGRLVFWVLARMTQLFAVAFNLGALCAFVVLPAIDDPAFGWRSRLLDEQEIVLASAVISMPWRGVWPEASPTHDEVAATRYSSVAERYTSRPHLDDRDPSEPLDPWAAWWPFLVASIGFYGLAPRLLYLIIAAMGTRRACSAVPFDRLEIRRICERMRWPVTRTAGVGDEASGAWPEEETAPRLAAWPTPERARALCWAGVDIADAALSQSLTERFGAAPATVHPVGEVDFAGDEAALDAVANAPADEGLYVVVASWEPPVGDQLDLLEAVRQRGGPGRPVLVVLHGKSADGVPASPEARHRAVWERAIRRRGDPRMFVAALISDAGSGEAA